MREIILFSNQIEDVQSVKDLPYLSIDADPILVQILSEPYLVCTKRGYQPIVKVILSKKKTIHLMFIAASSLTRQLEDLRLQNNGLFTGLEFWVRKESYKQMASYILEPY